MIKYLIVSLLIPVIPLNAQINRIDHIYIESAKAEVLFHFFKNEIQMPVSWDYQEWGSFTSGGVFFGNVNLEFTHSDTSKHAQFKGIALEPNSAASKICKDLDRLHICNDGVKEFYNPYSAKKAKDILWATIDLIDLLPENIHFFICDYKDRVKIKAKAKKQEKLLLKKQKERFNITSIGEIEIGVLDPERVKASLKELPGIIINGKDRFSFKKGINMKIVKSRTPGILQINVVVKSKETARQLLNAHQWLEKKRSDNRVFIDPPIIDNLRVEFVEE